jgi:2-phospho-L-lactate guanylyltransferase
MRSLAIVPIKRFALAKQRLSAQLDPVGRATLARAMVEDVLRTLRGAADLSGVLVVTNEPLIVALAEQLGASVLADEAEAGQSAAVGVGIAHALDGGIERVLIVPGDCPTLAGEELSALLQRSAATAPSVVVVPDRHGTGTNALLLTPPDVITPAFGPGSYARHLELAAQAGVACDIARPPGLLLDIDTPDDLAALLGGPTGGAPHTRAALAGVRTAG